MTQNVNLYAGSPPQKFDPLGIKQVVGYSAVVAVLITAFAVFAHSSLGKLEATAAENEKSLAVLRDSVQALGTRRGTPDPALQQQLRSAQRELGRRRAALSALGGPRGETLPDGYSTRLDSFARGAIDGLWLVGVTLKPDEIYLRGRALDTSLIPRYVDRLSREPSLQGVLLEGFDIKREPEHAAGAAESASGASSEAPLPYVDFSLSGVEMPLLPGSPPASTPVPRGARP